MNQFILKIKEKRAFLFLMTALGLFFIFGIIFIFNTENPEEEIIDFNNIEKQEENIYTEEEIFEILETLKPEENIYTEEEIFEILETLKP